MAYKDFYNILGVDKKAGEKEIKKAYRKLATEFHPDKTKGNKEKEERFKEISEAYQVLGNSEKRRQYDALGSDWEQFQQSGSSFDDFMDMRKRYREQAGRAQYAGSSSGGFGGSAGSADFSDIFDSIFGNRRSGRGRHTEGFPGADVSGELPISLQEAYTGTERILDIDGKKIKLKVKPGAYDGLQLKARGKGQKGGGGRAGDLYVQVRVSPHPVYSRKGDDLYMTAAIDLFDALLGGKVEINTLSGKVSVPLREGTQNGKTVRLKGKGMPIYGASGKFGDLFVTFEVSLPTQLTAEQRELLKRLKNDINKNK